MDSNNNDKGNKVFDITQLLTDKKPSDEFKLTITDDDIISFLKVAALVRSFSISEMAQVNLTETEMLIKVSNYLDIEEDKHIESGTNLQMASSMPFYPPEIESQISDATSVENFRRLLDKLEIAEQP